MSGSSGWAGSSASIPRKQANSNTSCASIRSGFNLLRSTPDGVLLATADQVSQTGEQLLQDLEQARQRVRVAQGLEQPDSSTQASTATAKEVNDSDG